MLDHAREAVQFNAGKTSQTIADDQLLSLAIQRLLVVIGEAASRVSDESRARHASIPWDATVNLRDRLRRGSDAVDAEIIQWIVDYDLPQLIDRLDAILPESTP